MLVQRKFLLCLKEISIPNTANDFGFKWQLRRGIEAEFEKRFARFCSAAGCIPYLYSLTLQFEQGLIRTVKKPERWDLVNALSLEVFKRINSHLVSDPHAARNQRLRLGFLTFTENRNRENLEVFEHTHSILFINPHSVLFARDKRLFGEPMIDRVINNARPFKTRGRWFDLRQDLCSYDLQMIHTPKDLQNTVGYDAKTLKFRDLDNHFSLITDDALGNFYEKKTKPRQTDFVSHH